MTNIFALLFPKKKKPASVGEFHNIYSYNRCPAGDELTKTSEDLCIIAPYIYKNVQIKPAILDIKRGNWSTRAVALSESLTDELIAEQCDRVSGALSSNSLSQALLIHVPSSAYSQGKKKFDHMEQCLRKIEHLCKNFFTLTTGAIQINKNKLKESQHKLNKKERVQNTIGKYYLSDQFMEYIQKHDPENLHIYCIDDITTTGTTFLTVSKLIKDRFQTVRITCIAIAK